MTLELLTITGHAPAIMGDDLAPFTHHLHGYRDGLTYTIPLQGEVPEWLTNYPKINGDATQEITVKRTLGIDGATTVILKVAGVAPAAAELAAAIEHFTLPKITTVTNNFVTNKFDLRADDPARAAAALAAPIVPEARLKGRDLTISIFKDNVLQDKLALIRDIVVTFADGVLVEFTAHQNCADYIDLMEAVRGGAKYSMGLIHMFPNGQARTFMLEHLDFKVIKLSAMGDKDMVELRFTVRAGSYQVLR